MEKGERIELKEASVNYSTGGRNVAALDGVSISIGLNERVSVVGESGAGKTTLGRAVLGLVRLDGGSIEFMGKDMGRMRRRAILDFRRQVQPVFQDPYDSMNPTQNVLQYLSMPQRFLMKSSRAEMREKSESLLETMGLESDMLWKYPHQLSGGQKQRIAIARALATEPRFIIADEPTSMLDASAAAGILNLLRKLAVERDMGYMLVTHNMGVAAYSADRIIVMYSGRVVEDQKTESIVTSPRHPYTSVLIGHAPVSAGVAVNRPTELAGSDADPDAIDPWKLAGCRYSARCTRRLDECTRVVPELKETGGGGRAACHNPLDAE